MNAATKKVIAHIASIQIEAIHRLNMDPNQDRTLASEYLKICPKVSQEEWQESVSNHLDLYQQMYEIPSVIRCLNEYQLLVCSHILFKVQAYLNVTNPEGVAGAWYEIDKAMLKFHPEFSLSCV